MKVIFEELSQILGSFSPTSILKIRIRTATGLTGPTILSTYLVQIRTRVRQEKNFALADEIRNKLAELGVSLEDRPGGTSWKVD